MLPIKNEKIRFNNYIFTIEDVDDRRVKRIKVTLAEDNKKHDEN